MPIFEFACTVCDHELEVIVLHGEKVPKKCPECGKPLRKKWSRVGVQLNGWGFARNDALLGDRPGRNDFKTVKEKASELFD